MIQACPAPDSLLPGKNWCGVIASKKHAEPCSGAVRAWRPLGRILLDRRLATDGQLAHALASQRSTGDRIGRALVRLAYVDDDDVKRALAEQHGLPFVDLDGVSIDRALARDVARAYARRHDVLPIGRNGNTLVVATTDPTRPDAVAELARTTGQRIDVVVTSESGMRRAEGRLYGDVADPIAGRGDLALSAAGGTTSTHEARPTVAADYDQHADAMLRRLLQDAVAAGASDVHLEVAPHGLRVRQRLDGVLRSIAAPDLQTQLDRHAREVISRIKVLAALDIAERRRPQDGSYRFITGHAAHDAMDLRVSILPTYLGESVVIRLLDPRRAPQSLDDLGLSPAIAGRLAHVLERTAGLVLVTGPTGSGKSTTLHACLRRLQRPEVRILTAEDPVEYVYDGISQCEVNDDIGNSFARYLRSFLRHDPEVIMVGEIRDEDTATMACRAAQTGHLLLSTLHTGTALAAVIRLNDLGVDRSLIATSLIAVLSQRLARRLCVACRRWSVTGPPLVAECSASAPRPATPRADAVGCPACGFTGYRGRFLVADLWVPDDDDSALVAAGASLAELRASARRTTTSMASDALGRLEAGATSIDELRRVLPADVILDLENLLCLPCISPSTGSAT